MNAFKKSQWKITMIFIFLEWSKEALIDAWMKDPVAACEKAGVTLPESKSILLSLLRRW